MTEPPHEPAAIDHLPEIGAFRPAPPAARRHRSPSRPEDIAALHPPPRWIWEAMEPADRREALQRLHDWIVWMRRRHREPPTDLNERIPDCWFLHPGPLDRLTALYSEWLRVHAVDSQLPIPSFLDALDRHMTILGYAGKCLKRRHGDIEDAEPIPDWGTWLATSEFATAPAVRLGFAVEPEPRSTDLMDLAWLTPDPDKALVLTGADMDRLVDSGEAQRLGQTPAVHYDGDWWFGDDETYVRVSDPQTKASMDEHAQSMRAAQKVIDEAGNDPS